MTIRSYCREPLFFSKKSNLMRRSFHGDAVIKRWLCLFLDFGFFREKNQKFSTVTSNRHLGMRVGAFESSDNEVTFFFLFYGYKTHRKNSRSTQTWQLLGFSWLIPKHLYENVSLLSKYPQWVMKTPKVAKFECF